MAHRMNQGRFASFSPQPSNENFHQFGVISCGCSSYTRSHNSVRVNTRPNLFYLGLIAMMAEAGADLFNCTCFNYPSLGDLHKYATYAAMLKRDGLVVDNSGHLPTGTVS